MGGGEQVYLNTVNVGHYEDPLGREAWYAGRNFDVLQGTLPLQVTTDGVHDVGFPLEIELELNLFRQLVNLPPSTQITKRPTRSSITMVAAVKSVQGPDWVVVGMVHTGDTMSNFSSVFDK